MRKKGIFLAGCSVLATLCLGGAMIGLNAQADSANVNWTTGFDLEANTPINSVLSIDAGYAELSSKKYDLEATVIYPDGRKVSNDIFVADVAGSYTVQYSFTADDGEMYTKDETFKVVQSASTLFTASEGVVMENNAVAPNWAVIPEENSDQYGERYTGLMIKPGKGGTSVTYNSLINLADNDLTEPLFEYIMIPEKDGSTDIMDIFVTLTDYFDPTNQLLFRLRAGAAISWPQFTLAQVRSVQQEDYAFNHISLGSIPQGTFDGKKPCSLAMYYDALSKQVYGWPNQNDKTFNRSIKTFLNDLDQATYSDYKWQGITGGLAYMEISFSGVTSSQGGIMLTNVDGQDLTAVEIDPAAEKVSIGVDYMGYLPDALPHAIVGTKYPVFDSVANSTISGIFGTTRVSVIDPKGNRVAIESGMFTPTTVGTYTVVYEAVAPSGKTCKKAVAIIADSEYRVPMSYTFSSDLLLKSNVFDSYYIYKGSEEGGEGNRSSVMSVKAPSGKDVPVRNDGGNDYFIPGEVGKHIITVTMSDFLGTAQNTFEVEIVSEKGAELEVPVIPYVLKVGTTFEFPQINVLKYQGAELVKAPATLKINGEAATSYSYNVAQEGIITVSYEADGAETFTQTVECRNLQDGQDEFMKNYFYSNTGTFAFEGKKLVYSGNSNVHMWQFANMLSIEDMAASIRLVGEVNEGTVEEPNVVSYDDNVSQIIFQFVDTEDAKNIVEIQLLRSVVDGEDVFTIVTNGGRTVMNATGNPFYQDYGFKVEKDTLNILDNAGQFVVKATHRVDAEPFNGFANGTAYVNVYAVTDGEGTFKMQIPTVSRQAIGNQERDKAAPMLLMNTTYASARRVLIGEQIIFSGARGYDVLTVFDTTVEFEVETPSGQKINVNNISEDYILTATEYGQYKAKYTVKDSAIDANSNSLTISVYVVELDAPEISIKGKYSTSAKLENGIAKVDLAKVEVTDASMAAETKAEKDGVVSIEDNVLTVTPSKGKAKTYAIPNEDFLISLNVKDGDVVQEGDVLFVASNIELYYIIINERDQHFFAQNTDEKGKYVNTNGVSYTFTKAGVYTVRIVAYDRFDNTSYVEYEIEVK